MARNTLSVRDVVEKVEALEGEWQEIINLHEEVQQRNKKMIIFLAVVQVIHTAVIFLI